MGTITHRAAAALLALATLAATLVVALAAAPAQAGWTDAGGITKYRICRSASPSGKGWVFVSRVRPRAGIPDARAGVTLHDGDRRRQRWSSGWLDDGETEHGKVRIQRSRGVRLLVWQEAGELDPVTDTGIDIGTALEARVYRPRQIERCGG